MIIEKTLENPENKKNLSSREGDAFTDEYV
jgi:hypothetical protein